MFSHVFSRHTNIGPFFHAAVLWFFRDFSSEQNSSSSCLNVGNVPSTTREVLYLSSGCLLVVHPMQGFFSVGLLYLSWALWVRRVHVKAMEVWLSTDLLVQIAACCTIAQSTCPAIRVAPCSTQLQTSPRGRVRL